MANVEFVFCFWITEYFGNIVFSLLVIAQLSKLLTLRVQLLDNIVYNYSYCNRTALSFSLFILRQHCRYVKDNVAYFRFALYLYCKRLLCQSFNTHIVIISSVSFRLVFKLIVQSYFVLLEHIFFLLTISYFVRYPSVVFSWSSGLLHQ